MSVGVPLNRNWSRFLHRLWLVGGAVWLALVGTVNVREWASRVPPRDTYDLIERCLSDRVIGFGEAAITGSLAAGRAELDGDTSPLAAARARLDQARSDGDDIRAMLAQRRVKKCRDAAAAIEKSRDRLTSAMWSTFGAGIVLPVVILLIGHGLAWALRGLRAEAR